VFSSEKLSMSTSRRFQPFILSITKPRRIQHGFACHLDTMEALIK
jgi:hypothetical protein